MQDCKHLNPIDKYMVKNPVVVFDQLANLRNAEFWHRSPRVGEKFKLCRPGHDPGHEFGRSTF